MLLWDEISGNLTIEILTTQQQHAITLCLHCISVFPGAAHIWKAGCDGWHGVTGLKIKVDIWRVKMIYFGKGIVICTAGRRSHGKVKAIFQVYFNSCITTSVKRIIMATATAWNFIKSPDPHQVYIHTPTRLKLILKSLILKSGSILKLNSVTFLITIDVRGVSCS